MTNEEIVETRAGSQSFTGLPLDQRLLRIEAEIIASVLAETGGNKSKAARRLGIKRSTLGDRITRCGLRQPAAQAFGQDIADRQIRRGANGER